MSEGRLGWHWENCCEFEPVRAPRFGGDECDNYTAS
jgi:hypothetical protein